MSLGSYFNPDLDLDLDLDVSASQPETDKEILRPNVKSANDRFEKNKDQYLRELLAKLEELKSPEPEPEQGLDRKPTYYYFIGRLNPPHEGHIEGLLNVIQMAIQNRGKAIILLGSGPDKGARTPKDPLDFKLKSEFIKDKLKDRLKEIYGQDFNVDSLFEHQVEIMEMGKPVGQIQEAIQRDIQRDIQRNGKKIDFLSNLISEIFAYRISGDKDGGEDLKKLEWIEKGLAKAGIIAAEGNLIPIRTSVISQPAVKMGVGDDEEPMSATTIRNIIYDMDPSTISNLEYVILNFKDQTGDFYVTKSGGDYTPAIAAAIYRYKPARTDAKMEVTLAPTKAVAKAKAPKKAAATVVAVPALKKRGTEEGTEEGPEEEGPTKKAGIDPNKSEGGSRRKTKRRTRKTKRRTRKTKRRRNRKTKRRRSRRN